MLVRHRWIFVTVACLVTLNQVKSTVVDMGTCGCVCGESSSDNEAVVTRDGVNSNFYNRIRGPKGAEGRIGKRGPPGPHGVRGPPGMKGEAGTGYEPATSCYHLRERGETRSGIYVIKPTARSATIEVFCDMESAGGGWTLVASIHENDIHGKCTLGDKWSSEQGQAGQNYKGSLNWMNYKTFGTPEGATSDDYKSKAYFDLLASDVMMWHVPNDVEINNASYSATLKYYTSTGFLTEYGGTLQSLFHNHYPLEAGEKQAILPGWGDYMGAEVLAAAFNRSAYTVRSSVSGFYLYTYDFSGAVQDHISDGGSDMFDTGNKVYFRIGNHAEVQMIYNVPYSHRPNGEDVAKILATTSHPFNVIMTIENTQRTVDNFSLRVVSGTGADGGGSTSTYTRKVVSGQFVLQYYTFNVYSASSDPSITEVFYHISNEQAWKSIPPSTVTKTPWTTADDDLQHGIRVTGRPRNIIMGYLLLSRPGGAIVVESEVTSVLSKTMAIFDQSYTGRVSLEPNDCGDLNKSLVQPINYLKGNDATVRSTIPQSVTRRSTPGFIQFIAHSEHGMPNAICPGVKTDSCRPQSICVGGMNSMHTDNATCGDFGGWDGMTWDSPTAHVPDGYARSLIDQQSSILIFTRKQN